MPLHALHQSLQNEPFYFIPMPFELVLTFKQQTNLSVIFNSLSRAFYTILPAILILLDLISVVVFVEAFKTKFNMSFSAIPF